MPKISVIIPVYNVEKYLRECLDSVVNQTLTDIEIICVDDGSTDNSLQILKEYAEKDNRIKIMQQQNQYAGVARNNGLKIATGEYVIFLDSDDIFDLKMLEKMSKISDKTNADITVCKSQKLNNESKKITPLQEYKFKEYLANKNTFSPDEVNKYIFQLCVGWPWDKLYKRNFITEHNLYFQDLRQSNDTFFVLFSFAIAQKVSICDEVLVTHRYHSSSLEATRNKHPECFISALKKLKNELVTNGIYEKYKQSFINYILSFSSWHISSTKDKKTKKYMKNLFMEYLQEVNFKQYKKSYFYDEKLYKKTKKRFFLYNLLKMITRLISNK